MLSPVVTPTQPSWYREVEVFGSKGVWHAFWWALIELNADDFAPCSVVSNEGAGGHSIDLHTHPRGRPVRVSLNLSIFVRLEVLFRCRFARFRYHSAGYVLRCFEPLGKVERLLNEVRASHSCSPKPPSSSSSKASMSGSSSSSMNPSSSKCESKSGRRGRCPFGQSRPLSTILSTRSW